MAVSTIQNRNFLTATTSVTVTLSSTTTVSYSASIAKDGYKPLAIAGWYLNRNDVIPTTIIVDNEQETVRGGLSKTSSGSATVQLSVRIVYEPN